MKTRYGIDIWADDNFIIDDGLVKVNYDIKPSLISIVTLSAKLLKPCRLIFNNFIYFHPHLIQSHS